MFVSKLQEKLNEAIRASSPIIAIVLILSLTVAPMPTSIVLAFLFGGFLLMIGMMLFSLGSELAMEPMGGQLGSRITKSRKLALILILGFLLGFMITISEPDLQVLANQVPAIPNLTLILFVGIGVGLFLLLALVRILLGISLQTMLLVFYLLILILSRFAPESFLAVAFDSGGVTTGPMTVPFIMAFGIGVSAIRSDRKAADDSFGLIALCSVGPILAVLLLSLIYCPQDAGYTPMVMPAADYSVELGQLFLTAFPNYLKEIALSLLPITAFFGIFQIFSLKLDRHILRHIGVGLLYTYTGLVLFLTGVNVGFMPAGSFLGQTLASLPCRWIIIPLGMLIGYFIVRAEPAIYVLMKQVEDLTAGGISGKALQTSLSVGVSVSIGLAMTRVLTGVSIFWFIVPGYCIALILSFFVPPIFTAIAFDSGGVASGPMTATFLLPFAAGACLAVGGNVVTDAFGVVAMVAMTPLITIQILGLVYRIRSASSAHTAAAAAPCADPDDFAIIEL